MTAKQITDPEARLKRLTVWYAILLAVDVVFAINFAVQGDSAALMLIACVLLIPLIGFPLLTNILYRKVLTLPYTGNAPRYLALAMSVASLAAIVLFYIISPLFLVVAVLNTAVYFTAPLIAPVLMALAGIVLAIDSIRTIRAIPW
jgi:hypothetical protein